MATAVYFHSIRHFIPPILHHYLPHQTMSNHILPHHTIDIVTLHIIPFLYSPTDMHVQFQSNFTVLTISLPKPSFGCTLNNVNLGSFIFGNFIFLRYPRNTPSFFFFFRFTFSTANFEMQQHIKIMINTAIVTPMISPIAACFL